ncbi:MAG: hypothetical protein ACRDBL_09540 [Rhabdaerophilum sp.]
MSLVSPAVLHATFEILLLFCIGAAALIAAIFGHVYRDPIMGRGAPLIAFIALLAFGLGLYRLIS